MARIIISIIATFAISNCVYTQDTVTVVKLKWSKMNDPFMKSFYIQNDTIFEKERGETSNEDMNKFINLTHQKNIFNFMITTDDSC